MTDVNEQIPSYSFFCFIAFFFLELSCVTSFFFFSFHAFLFFFSFGVALFFFFFRCWTFSFFFLGGAEFVLLVFVSLSLVSYFLGALCFLSLSLDRLNKPFRNRFLLVLSRFFDRLRGTMATQSKTIS